MKNIMMPVAAVCTTLLGLISVPAVAATQYTWEPDYTSRTHYSSDRLRKTQICGYGERSDSSCGGKFVAVPDTEPPGGDFEINPTSRCIGNVPGRVNLVEAVNVNDFNAARFTFEIVSGNPDFPTAYFLSQAAFTNEGKGTKNVFCKPGTTAAQAWDWVNAYGGTWDREDDGRYVMIDSDAKQWDYLGVWINETNGYGIGGGYGSGGGLIYSALGASTRFYSTPHSYPFLMWNGYLIGLAQFCGEGKLYLSPAEAKIGIDLWQWRGINSGTISTVNNIRRFTLAYFTSSLSRLHSGNYSCKWK
ncbi:hypothetical protein [Corticibacter populi]|uniref:hypothetical protein n=1 Tax=Corticibacter populi TaxID=1550736 RepID=UPI00102CA0B4|nr:hypothetical protein [Corticibacter populi]RZS35425.1 hypothetical protein EV687_0491 [Corticibacter populi]